MDRTYDKPEDCLWWAMLARLTRDTLGIVPPETAEELKDALGERRVIQEAG